jgi:hypothetical protein
LSFLEIVKATGEVDLSEKVAQGNISAAFESKEDAPSDKLWFAFCQRLVEPCKITSFYARYEGAENAF